MFNTGVYAERGVVEVLRNVEQTFLTSSVFPLVVPERRLYAGRGDSNVVRSKAQIFKLSMRCFRIKKSELRAVGAWRPIDLQSSAESAANLTLAVTVSPEEAAACLSQDACIWSKKRPDI